MSIVEVEFARLADEPHYRTNPSHERVSNDDLETAFVQQLSRLAAQAGSRLTADECNQLSLMVAQGELVVTPGKTWTLKTAGDKNFITIPEDIAHPDDEIAGIALMSIAADLRQLLPANDLVAAAVALLAEKPLNSDLVKESRQRVSEAELGLALEEALIEQLHNYSWEKPFALEWLYQMLVDRKIIVKAARKLRFFRIDHRRRAGFEYMLFVSPELVNEPDEPAHLAHILNRIEYQIKRVWEKESLISHKQTGR